MKYRISFTGFLMAMLMPWAAGIALAEVTLTTDKIDYQLGEIVHITAHNAGPSEEQFVSDPYFFIANEDLNECVYGCVGLAVITPFEVGETVSLDWDTGEIPLIPGIYSIGVVTTNGTSVLITLNDIVATDAKSWGALKVLYR